MSEDDKIIVYGILLGIIIGMWIAVFMLLTPIYDRNTKIQELESENNKLTNIIIQAGY